MNDDLSVLGLGHRADSLFWYALVLAIATLAVLVLIAHFAR